eukprot:jgi/Bigna1/78269/fgenesh1_pg.53_\
MKNEVPKGETEAKESANKKPDIQIFGSVRVATNKPDADAEDHGHSHGHGHGHGHGGTCSEHETKKTENTDDPDLKFAPNIPEIDLTNERLRMIPKGISGLEKLQKLTLRTNAIGEISRLSKMRSLKELDLYENKISKIDGLDECPALTSLDLSFNEIRKIENLSSLQDTLTHLYLIANLKELFIGRNKITELKGLELKSLEKLSMQSNRVVTIGDGLKGLPMLQELYLSHNGIQRMEGFDAIPQLKVLDLGGNQIKKIENIEALVELEELWMNNNFLTDFENLKQIKARELKTIYLEQNPLSKDPDYENKVLNALPTLTQLDADMYERNVEAKGDDDDKDKPTIEK